MNGSSGCFDYYGNHVNGVIPEHVHDLFGIEIGENMPCKVFEPVFKDDQDFFRKEPVVGGVFDQEEVRGTFSTWTSYLHPTTADVVMSFENSQLCGQPFCTVNQYGKGYALYYNADRIDQNLCDKIIRFAAQKAKLSPVPYPETVSVVKRGNLAFLFNFSDETVSFTVDFCGKNLLGNALSKNKVTLPPQEYALVEIIK